MPYNPEHRNFNHVVLHLMHREGTTKSGRSRTEFRWFDPATGRDHSAKGYGEGIRQPGVMTGRFVDIIKDGRGSVIVVRLSEDKT